MLLCRKIKIEVSDQDAATLEFMQGKCRGLYNWWVMQLRNGERWNVYAAKKTLQKSRKHDPEINGVYGKLLHEVFFRLDEAMQAFFRRVAEGETLILPTGGGGKWGVKRFPDIIAHLTERPPEHFREVAVSRDARGNYYCSFVFDDAEQDSKDDEHKSSKNRKKRKTLAI